MSHLLIKIKAKIERFFRNTSFSFEKCFSKSNGNIATFFFDNEERMNFFKKFQHFWSINLPDILFFPIWLRFSAGGIAFINATSKVLKDPINKTFIGRS